jgi:hypothetical protein
MGGGTGFREGPRALSDERPDALLKSALEKIVYFEARSEQLVREAAASAAEAGRLKKEIASAAQREIELRRTVASLEVELGRARREREEIGRINDALRAERAALTEKMIEASQIHGGARSDDDAPFDLASFIAQLRSEVLAASGPPAAPRPADGAVTPRAVPGAQSAAPATASAAPPAQVDATRARQGQVLDGRDVAAHAERFLSQGRLQVSNEDVAALANSAAFDGRAEETIFGFSVRELSAPDPLARQRAAERLRALHQVACAPALATALHGEDEPRVQVALLQAFAEVATQEGTAVVRPLLDAPNPDVRIAALKALLALDPAKAGPHLSAAMRDADRAVRRRASLMALSLAGEAALGLGEQAIRDVDADVRSLGALVLGAGVGERARSLLLTALRDPEKKVRRAAAQSLSRLLGEDVSGVVELDDTHRRREVRRLGTLPARPVRAPAQPVSRIAPAPAQVAAAQIAPVNSPAAPAAARAVVAVMAVEAGVRGTSRQVSEALCSAVAGELRISLRGRTAAELSAITGEPPAAVTDVCELLAARGQAVRRGTKFFAA